MVNVKAIPWLAVGDLSAGVTALGREKRGESARREFKS